MGIHSFHWLISDDDSSVRRVKRIEKSSTIDMLFAAAGLVPVVIGGGVVALEFRRL
jgi:hypothetical protein